MKIIENVLKRKVQALMKANAMQFGMLSREITEALFLCSLSILEKENAKKCN